MIFLKSEKCSNIGQEAILKPKINCFLTSSYQSDNYILYLTAFQVDFFFTKNILYNSPVFYMPYIGL